MAGGWLGGDWGRPQTGSYRIFPPRRKHCPARECAGVGVEGAEDGPTLGTFEHHEHAARRAEQTQRPLAHRETTAHLIDQHQIGREPLSN